MYVSKDMYEYLMNFVDERAFLSMICVNRKYYERFEEFMKKRYPLLENDSPYENKIFYLRMIYYIDKMKSKIPYIPSKNFHPEKIYNIWYNHPIIYDITLAYAAEAGLYDYVEIMIAKGAQNFNIAALWTCDVGNLEMLKYLIEKGADHYINFRKSASENGHQHILEYLDSLIS